MSSHEHTAHAEHADAGHGHGGPAVYTRTLIALLILTGITVGAAGVHFESSTVNVVIALTIATIKATLVALFFMHLKWDKPVNAIIAVGGFLFLGIFLMFDLLDFNSRVNYQPVNLTAPAVTAPVPGAAVGGPPMEESKGATEHK